MKKFISALPLLQPITIFNTRTGEQITVEQHMENVNYLLDYVHNEAQHVYDIHQNHIHTILANRNKIVSPADYGRRNNIHARKNLPRTIKAQSRVEKLVQHKIITETASYIMNQNPNKQIFSFNHTINLGAVDKQMASISINNQELTLLWKCWDTEYLLTFIIPEYVTKRNIIKYSLPIVSSKGYRFSITESVPERGGFHVAGLDLGRVEPYTIAVVNPSSARVAHYTTSGRLNQLNRKRERLIVEKKYIFNKAQHYEQLGISPDVLWSEYAFKRNKITVLGKVIAQQVGSEITKKLVKHKLNTLNMENLTWVTGAKYGSKWNHSNQQASITHSLLRVGVRVRKVNPRNTSQVCHACSEPITHNTNNRTVWCANCKIQLDRDFNAAMNIAKNKRYPVSQRQNGDSPSFIMKQAVEVTHNSYVKKKNLFNEQEKQLT